MQIQVPRKKKLALAISAGVLSFIALEGAANLLLAWSDREPTGITERSHCVYDPLLGWVNEKNLSVENLYGPGLTLTTNERGLRGSTPVASTTPPDRFRILCLGDSFTLGHGVDDRATFPAWLERLTPKVQAINMGQGGYGIDQCYLWYRRDADDLQADVVLLSFIAPDFARMLDERFQGDYPKPRLTLEGDALVLPREPLTREWTRGSPTLGGFAGNLALRELLLRLGRQLGNGGRPALEVTAVDDYRALGEALLLDLKRLVEERGGRLALAHIPLRDPGASNPDALLKWLGPFARSLDLPLIDLRDDFTHFVPGEAASLYLEDGHMNASGNRRIAELLLARLRGHFPALAD